MSVEIGDLLSVTAEVSVGFAGFAGLITAVRRADQLTRTDAVGLAMIVWLSLTCFFGAVIPMALFSLGLPDPDVWMWTSGIVVIICVSGTLIAFFGMSRTRVSRQIKASPLVALLGWIAPLVVGALNGMNSFGILYHQEPTPVVMAGLLAFLLAAYYFARLLLDPVWKAVSINRASERAASDMENDPHIT